MADAPLPFSVESSRFRSYPEYKDTGVEWLGEIPGHWTVSKLKNWLETNRQVLPEDTDSDYEFDYLDIGSVGTDRLSARPKKTRFGSAPSRARRVVGTGDTIVSTVRTYLKAVWHAEGPVADLIASTGFAVLTPGPDSFPKFVSYVCQGESFLSRVAAESSGVSYPAIAETKLGVLEVSVPSLVEQAAIARFLDRETTRIDALATKHQDLVKLLQEKRTALVSSAATKGLDPGVAMKDSGVEWLGEIPVHWEVTKLGYVTECLDGRRVPLNAEQRALMQGEYPYWGANSIVDYVDSWLFDESLVLLGEDGAPFFEEDKPVAFHVSGKVWVNNHAHVLRPASFISPEFLASALNGVDYSWYIAGATRDKLTQSDMRSIPVQLPPLHEQHAISSYLERETRKLDALASTAGEVVEMLKEYRTALISAAVTGKIDVRHDRERTVPSDTSTARSRQ